MPTERAEVAAALLGGLLYVVGGFLASGGATDVVEVYDPARDSWRRVVGLPAARHHPAATGVDSTLYVVGGYDERGGPVNTLFAYDPRADRWEQRRPMPTARGALGAVAIGGTIYAVGGTTGVDTGATERYDPKSDTWERRRPMPTPRDHLGVAPAGNQIVVCGGRVGDFARNLDATEVYEVDADRWTRRAPMPTARSGIAAAALEARGRTRIFVFGGENPSKTFDENEEYDPAADRWTKRLSMRAGRHGLGAVAVAGQIFVLAGGPRPGLSTTGLNEAYTPADAG